MKETKRVRGGGRKTDGREGINVMMRRSRKGKDKYLKSYISTQSVASSNMCFQS